MDCTKEGNDDGTVAKLHGFDEGEKILSSLVINEDGIVERIARWDVLAQIPSQERGRKRGT